MSQDFDPDAFLAAPDANEAAPVSSPGGFDPDAFLASPGAAPAGAFNPDAFLAAPVTEPSLLDRAGAMVKAGAAGVADAFLTGQQGLAGLGADMVRSVERAPGLQSVLPPPLAAALTGVHAVSKGVSMAEAELMGRQGVVDPTRPLREFAEQAGENRATLAEVRARAEEVAPVGAKVAGIGGTIAGIVPQAVLAPAASIPLLMGAGAQQTADYLPAGATEEQKMLARLGGAPTGILDRFIPGGLAAKGLKNILLEAGKQGLINLGQGSAQRAVAIAAGAEMTPEDLLKAGAVDVVSGAGIPIVGAGARKALELPGSIRGREAAVPEGGVAGAAAEAMAAGEGAGREVAAPVLAEAPGPGEAVAARGADFAVPPEGRSMPLSVEAESLGGVGGGEASTPGTPGARAKVGELSIQETPAYTPPEVLAQDPKLPLGARILRAVREGKGNLVGFASSKFTTKGAMPSGVYFAKEAATGRMNENALRVRHATQDFAKAMSEAHEGRKVFTEAELRPVNAALAGDAAAFDALAPGVQEHVERMRAMVRGQQARLVEEGLVAGSLKEGIQAQIDGDANAYLNRSYRIFDDKGWVKSVPEAAKRRVMAVLSEQFPEMTPEQQVGAVNNLLHVEDGPMAALSKLGKREASMLMERGEIHPAVRALWGEYTDPLVNFTKTMQKMSSFVENARLQREIEKMGKGVFLFDTPTGEHAVNIGGTERGVWGAMEEARRAAAEVDPHAEPGDVAPETAAEAKAALGPLAKYHTTPEIAAVLRNMDEAVKETNPITRQLLRASGMVQFNQTVLSPTTHIRNFTGNVAIMAANGHLGANGARDGYTVLRDAFRTNDAARESIAKYTRLGLVGDSLNAGLMREVIDRAKVMEKGGDNIAVEGLRKALNKTVKLYGAEDDFFKVMAFERERKLLGEAYPEAVPADLDVQAANRVKDFMPTFSRTPQAVAFMRRQPFVGNFIAWPSELLRTSANTIDIAVRDMRSGNPVLQRNGAKRLASFMAVAVVAPAALEGVSAMMQGWNKDKKEAMREMLPEFQRNTPVVWLGKDEKGMERTMSLDGMLPHSLFHKPIVAMLRNKFERNESDAGVARIADAMGEAAAPWSGEKILYSKVADLARNKDALSGRPIWNDTDSYGDKVAKGAGHVGAVFLPGAANTAQRIYKATQGTVEDTGRAYSLKDEVGAAVGGQRVSSVDVNRAITGRLRGFNAREAAAGESLRGAVNAFKNNATAATPERFLKDWEDTQERRLREYQSMSKVMRASEVLRVDRGVLARAAKEGGLGAKEMGAVWRGKFIPTLPAREDMLMIMSKPGGAEAIRAVQSKWGEWFMRPLDSGEAE